MTQGMFSAVSGIRANQTKLNVISNNIANVNTLGFKSSSANFANVFAQTITGGTPPNGVLGGTNPRQVGNGTLVSEIASNFSQGGTQFTGRNTDLMINGEGFFAVERIDVNNPTNTDYFLTRAGNFTLDSSGNLVTSAGNRVRGTSQLAGSLVDTLGRVNIPLSFVVLKDSDANNNIMGTHIVRELTTAETTAGIDYNDTVAPAGPVLFPLSAGATQRTVTPVELRNFTIGSDGSISATYSNGDRITVRTDASTVVAGDPSQSRRQIIHLPYEGGTYAAINVGATDSGQMDQFEPSSANPVAGYGVFDGGTTGISADDAMEGMQLQLQAATVTNPAGLIYDGNNNFLQGANSGTTQFGISGSGSRGGMQAGALESSNVDMAGEFTNMIIAQRGLEAASRVIRAQSEVMQTIIQVV